MNRYTTDDLYRASALIMQGFPPDQYIRIHGNGGKQRIIVALSWNDLPGDILEQLNNKELRVEPLEFKKVYLEQKKKIFKIVDEVENEISDRVA